MKKEKKWSGSYKSVGASIDQYWSQNIILEICTCPFLVHKMSV